IAWVALPVDERTALLDQLRIERSEQAAARGGRTVWVLGIAASAVAAVAAGWWIVAPPQAVTVTAVAAQAAPDVPAGQRGSILDASGYVVARRQATVAAKVTGRVVDLEIEEGQRVE